MSPENAKQRPAYLHQLANEDFNNAYQRGFWRSVLGWILKEDNRLLDFDEVRRHLPLRGQHYAGLQQIPLDRVVGSMGRYQDFDRAFLPRRMQIRERWTSIDRAHIEAVSLPPIEVYQVGEIYFVKDGNHRVSVARERGQAFIDAAVTEIAVPVKLDEKTRIEDLVRQHEKIAFFAETSLNQLRPNAEIDLTMPAQYQKLLEHIAVHRWFLGAQLQHEISFDEAVQSWYDKVYTPLVEVIREQGILKEFPGRTEADLYLWVIEHLWYLRDEAQGEISMERAAKHFAERYSERQSGRARWFGRAQWRKRLLSVRWIKRLIPDPFYWIKRNRQPRFLFTLFDMIRRAVIHAKED